MSCVSSRLQHCLLLEKILSFELLQKVAGTMILSDHQTSKMGSFQHHDGNIINVIRRLAVDKKDTSNDRKRETK